MATTVPTAPLAVFVMGVTGSGKSTLGSALGDAWGWPYHDADDYHPAGNVAKMRTGTPLTDEDRAPWLAALHQAAAHAVAEGRGIVIGCSALKEHYRAVLRGDLTRVVFLWLDVPEGVLQARMDARKGHFMPASLLASQLATLERPTGALRLEGNQPVEALVEQSTALVVQWQRQFPGQAWPRRP
jgi:gluconokinase